MARGKVGLYVDADMSEGIQSASFVEEFLTRMSTPAHVRTVVVETHRIFSDDFDKHMGLVARSKPEAFHHVYEYSPTGDGYRWIGNNNHKLWVHTRQGTGTNLTFSWNWLPAKQSNPTYSQRRRSRVGWDAIRTLSNKEYRELLSKHREQGSRKWTFTWKAPLLEYGIARRQTASRTAMMMPTFDRGEETGSVKLFRKDSVAREQQPGKTKGNFVQQWTMFWGESVPSRWNEVVGEVVERDAKKRIEAGLLIAKKPTSRVRKFQARAIVNPAEAMAAGREQAISAMRSHTNSIRSIETNRGRFSAIDY